MIVTAWIIAIHAMVISTGGIVGASSLPDSWPTEQECKVEAAKAQEYITRTRPDLAEIEVRCVPHQKLVEEDPKAAK